MKTLDRKNFNHVQEGGVNDLKFDFQMSNMDEIEKIKPSLLLHSCCGPCSSAVIERLNSNHKITVFFYNPNITSREEYEKRKESQILFIDEYNDEKENDFKIDFLEGAYYPDEFIKIVIGMESEPEGGKRCACCFRLRLEKTAETANLLGYDSFATTLTVSPHKNYDTISDIGLNLAIVNDIEFLNENFKKNDGYKRSIELSKKYQLYRQNYCGCKYSILI